MHDRVAGVTGAVTGVDVAVENTGLVAPLLEGGNVGGRKRVQHA